MSAVGALLTRIVDYAGLFPPASLDMDRAVRKFRTYLGGDHAWMLANFVLPAARLAEFADTFAAICCDEQEQPWTLSVVTSADSAPEDLQAIDDFQQGAAFLSAVEIKVPTLTTARSILKILPRGRAHYVETAPDRATKFLPLLASTGARAKLRTGGIIPEAIPEPEAIAGFLLNCAKARVPFKATAGLHHAVRGVQPLTYQLGSPTAATYGFLNVFLAAALAYHGSDEKALLKTLTEEDPKAFQLDEDAIAWHDHHMTSDQIERARAEFAIGFGSCSFTEPIDDLKAMGWL
jgi:hypothetical protein